MGKIGFVAGAIGTLMLVGGGESKVHAEGQPPAAHQPMSQGGGGHAMGMPETSRRDQPSVGAEHGGPGAEHGKTVVGSPAAAAYRAAIDRMHAGMNKQLSGDPDRDFAEGMIPHHQGAIDMAKVELEYGQDPELKKIAAAVIEAQEAEIAFLEAWLMKHPR
jgi:uncharacterized protein (DUF305 family)